VGVVARRLEEAGLVTVGISLVREHTEKLKPPRALWVPFPFGLPLGHPDDLVEQRAVLDAALALLDEPEVPVLRDYAGQLAERGETALPLFLRYCVDDLRVLYLEARLVMKPGETQADTQRWFWGETALGSFLRTLRDAMNGSDDEVMRGCANGIAR